MNAKTITTIVPAASKPRGAKPAKGDATKAAQAIMDKLTANIAAEPLVSEAAQGFASLVAEHKADILRCADRTSTAREGLRSIIKLLAEYAASHGVARIDAGKMLAQVLGFKNLQENKDIANAWQYAAGNAGLESTRKGPAGKVTSGKADLSDSDKSDGGDGALVAAQSPVKIAANASAQDVVDAFSKWAAKHKAQAREALEMIATWREMVAVQAELAKAA